MQIATPSVITRRHALGVLGGVAGLLGAGVSASRAATVDASDDVLSEGAVLRDPDIPVAGNANGDVTIVEYFDYNCPYCRKLAPELAQVVFDDGKVRMVFKDWPILGPVSVYASKMALATRYQDKFVQAHEAMMNTSSRITESRIREMLTEAKIDVDRATRDLETHGAEIDRVLKRNEEQAKAFGFRGTPSFIVGKFRVPGILTMAQFDQAIADARKAAKAKK
ncbi:MAG: DsbA family protein [Rhizobiales bacterium]|nr:DsbA family protein [Hyphomicrobiales bacterium]MBN8985088.1 DsbA family protein [Hyphomicrobiales bacterium]